MTAILNADSVVEQRPVNTLDARNQEENGTMGKGLAAERAKLFVLDGTTGHWFIPAANAAAVPARPSAVSPVPIPDPIRPSQVAAKGDGVSSAVLCAFPPEETLATVDAPADVETAPPIVPEPTRLAHQPEPSSMASLAVEDPAEGGLPAVHLSTRPTEKTPALVEEPDNVAVLPIVSESTSLVPHRGEIMLPLMMAAMDYLKLGWAIIPVGR
jgi:hypothetical protein